MHVGRAAVATTAAAAVTAAASVLYHDVYHGSSCSQLACTADPPASLPSPPQLHAHGHGLCRPGHRHPLHPSTRRQRLHCRVSGGVEQEGVGVWVGEWGCRVRWGNTSVCRMTVCAGWLCVQDGISCLVGCEWPPLPLPAGPPTSGMDGSRAWAQTWQVQPHPQSGGLCLHLSMCCCTPQHLAATHRYPCNFTRL